MVLPGYDGTSILNLMESFRRLFGSGSHHAPLEKSFHEQFRSNTTTILFVFDGMGKHLLERYPHSFLATHCTGTLTSVFPTATVPAISTFLTGLSPKEHGLPGWFSCGKEETFVSFRALPRHTSLPEWTAKRFAPTLYTVPSFFSTLPCPSLFLQPKSILSSLYSKHFSHGAKKKSYTSLSEYFSHLLSALQHATTPSFLYAYVSDLDTVGHHHGPTSPEMDRTFHLLDEACKDFWEKAQQFSVQCVITADHGMLETHPDQEIFLSDYPDISPLLRIPIGGEARVPFFSALPEHQDKLFTLLSTQLASYATPHWTKDLIREGYFGPGAPHPALQERVGDIALFMKDRYYFSDHDKTTPLAHFGAHGGLHPDELFVPFIFLSSAL